MFPTTPLSESLDALLNDAKFKGATLACVVEDTDGHVLYGRNEDTRLLPASNEKLVTTSFALWKLGANYRCQLSFWNEKKGLVVRSTGDPLLSQRALQDLRKKLNPHNRPVFLSQSYQPGFNVLWELGDLPNRYSAPVTALTLDRGGLELWSIKGKAVLRPGSFGIRVDFKPSVGPPNDVFDVFRKRITVTGTLPKEDTRLDTLCLPEPDLAAASYLGRRVIRSQEVPHRPPDFVYAGSTMSDLLHLCLQNSDNNIAENFLLMAASHGQDLKDPYAQAIDHLQMFLKGDLGLGPEMLRPADGSGLARWNFVTVSGLAQLLRWNLKQPTAELWRDSLDRPGLGTMVTRMAGVPFRGKTGTLTGVSALSGYLEMPGGKTYVISFIANSFLCPGSEVKAFEDKLITTIQKSLASGTPIAGGA
jgi:D-alanyl-D-alanine carboxypeptidase/D-alanyl-D-alanine-endopeptidase (penicillin-binding protein 4)